MTHSRAIIHELTWLEKCIAVRAKSTASGKNESLPSPDDLAGKDDQFAKFIKSHDLNPDERLILILALSTYLNSNILAPFLSSKEIYQKCKAVKSSHQTALLPTVETALFLLADDDIERRIQCRTYFEVDHLFYHLSVLELAMPMEHDTWLQSVLGVSKVHRDLFIDNKLSKPKFSHEFPAQLLTTERLSWDDLRLSENTAARLEEVKIHLALYDKVMNEWDMTSHQKNGCRILFYGDSGTGKTLTATLLGAHLNRDVYRVDIATVTSKYVGEATKRLNALFNAAENKNWILFFDEGDAMLGQRQNNGGDGKVSQYANQDVAFLLQRIETFTGIVVVASNLKNNIDPAFLRRFEHLVRFDSIDKDAQYDFWMENLPKQCELEAPQDLRRLINQYSLSPAATINVVQRLSLLAWHHKWEKFPASEVARCVQDEAVKYLGKRPMGH